MAREHWVHVWDVPLNVDPDEDQVRGGGVGLELATHTCM
jgi:hypothetical protein